MKEKDKIFQEQATVIWSLLRQHVGRRQQKVLAGEKLGNSLRISEQMPPSSNPGSEAEQSVSTFCCRDTALCLPPREMLYLRKPRTKYVSRQNVNTCKEPKDSSLFLYCHKRFLLFIKILRGKKRKRRNQKTPPETETMLSHDFVVQPTS